MPQRQMLESGQSSQASMWVLFVCVLACALAAKDPTVERLASGAGRECGGWWSVLTLRRRNAPPARGVCSWRCVVCVGGTAHVA